MMSTTAQKSWISMSHPRWMNSFTRREQKPADIEASLFEALFEQHWESICRTLFRLLGDWDEAEDLALETFLQLHSNPPREDHSLVGWLYRVATNKGFNALRARRRRLQYEHQAGLETLETTTAADPAQDVERRLETEQIRTALQSIRPRAAHLLLLRYSGLSYVEIAEALELAPGSIGTLLARAEKQLEAAYYRVKDGMR